MIRPSLAIERFRNDRPFAMRRNGEDPRPFRRSERSGFETMLNCRYSSVSVSVSALRSEIPTGDDTVRRLSKWRRRMMTTIAKADRRPSESALRQPSRAHTTTPLRRPSTDRAFDKRSKMRPSFNFNRSKLSCPPTAISAIRARNALGSVKLDSPTPARRAACRPSEPAAEFSRYRDNCR